MPIFRTLGRLLLPAMVIALVVSLSLSFVSQKQRTNSFISGYHSRVQEYGFPLAVYSRTTTSGSSSGREITNSSFDIVNFLFDLYVWWLVSLAAGLVWLGYQARFQRARLRR